MKKVRKILVMLFLLFLVSILIGCNQETNSNVDDNNLENSSKENQENNENSEDNIKVWDETGDKITVKVLYPANQEQFQTHVVEKYKDALPLNIELEGISLDPNVVDLQEMNAQQIVPDIMRADHILGIEPFVELDMLETIDEYVEMYGVDLSEFDESVIATYRAMDPKGEGRLTGLPTFVDRIGLFYNKEIFDLFGVEYPDPEIPMTWEEFRNLAAKMTGERNGVSYKGAEFGSGLTGRQALFPLQEFSINLTDPETGEVLLRESPEFKQYLDFMDEIYRIPNLYDPSEEARKVDHFAEKTAAMNLSWPGYLRFGLGGDPDYNANIDVAPIPVWEDGGTGPRLQSHPFVLNKYSENKDAAFQVMLAIARVEAMDPLTSPHTEFSPNTKTDFYPIYENKNMEAFWSYEGTLPPERISKWDDYVDVRGSLSKLAEGLVDVNQLIRELTEESQIKIQEAIEQE